MRMRSPSRGQKGFTLLEIIFALAILMLGSYLVLEGVGQLEDLNKDTRVLSATERQINIIVDNLRTGLAQYQITYDASPTVKNELLDIKKLPMAWTGGVEVPVAECSAPGRGCPPGRYGYLVQPIPQFRGLYQVTLRMTHTEWKESFRDYEFLVTVQ